MYLVMKIEDEKNHILFLQNKNGVMQELRGNVNYQRNV